MSEKDYFTPLKWHVIYLVLGSTRSWCFPLLSLMGFGIVQFSHSRLRGIVVALAKGNDKFSEAILMPSYSRQGSRVNPAWVVCAIHFREVIFPQHTLCLWKSVLMYGASILLPFCLHLLHSACKTERLAWLKSTYISSYEIMTVKWPVKLFML